MGFDARWGVLGAADIGAPHQRDRIWIVGKQMGNTYNNGPITSEISKSLAQRSDSSSTQQEQASKLERSGEQYAELAHTNGMRQLQPQGSESDQRGWVGDSGEQVADTDSTQRQGDKCTERGAAERTDIGKPSWWVTEPNVGRVADGVAARVDRLKAIGNGQVPLCAATAWKLFTGGMK